ncbi:hypothetical protein NIIDMKKI_46690 [Mycobacterium kansasii]|uniref:Uncharacterized protein n=1 Tax=Mycobacterium kansasii TaxID=1768 RepID=A0A7G1IH17_MYCKA|nr:hypothetical protein NIIDMKKI_46690 [Mycobacterium kansasii]
MPASANRDAVDHVGRPEHDVTLRQRLGQRIARPPVLVAASRTLRSVRVDDHGDRGLGVSRGGDLRELLDLVAKVFRQVNAHHRSQFTLGHRDQDQRFFRHEAEDGRQRRDQCAGAIQFKVRSMLRHRRQR